MYIGETGKHIGWQRGQIVIIQPEGCQCCKTVKDTRWQRGQRVVIQGERCQCREPIKVANFQCCDRLIPQIKSHNRCEMCFSDIVSGSDTGCSYDSVTHCRSTLVDRRYRGFDYIGDIDCDSDARTPAVSIGNRNRYRIR